MTLHVSLVGVLLICSAFVGSKEEPKDNVIDIIPFGGNFTVTDGPSHGGGTPPPVQPVKAPQPVQAPPPPAPAAQREEQVEPTPKKIEKPVEKVEKVEKTKPVVKDDGEEFTSKKTHTPKISLKPVIRTAKTTKTNGKTRDTDGEADSRAETDRKNRAKLASTIFGMADSISRSTAQSVVSDSFGDGSGGVAAVNYRTVLFTRYYNAWLSPEEVDDNDATTDARIVIARDGTVVSWTIERRSGSSSMDRSVERALRSVRKIEAFPPAWRESEKTFRIRFNLKSKLGIG